MAETAEKVYSKETHGLIVKSNEIIKKKIDKNRIKNGQAIFIFDGWIFSISRKIF